MRRSLVLCSRRGTEGSSRFRKSEAFITGTRDTRRKSAGSKLRSYRHSPATTPRLQCTVQPSAGRSAKFVPYDGVPGGHPPRMASRDPRLGQASTLPRWRSAEFLANDKEIIVADQADYKKRQIPVDWRLLVSVCADIVHKLVRLPVVTTTTGRRWLIAKRANSSRLETPVLSKILLR